MIWFRYGLYIMNTNIPRLFIFIKNKAVLYIRTSFIFHSVCRLSNSFPSSMSQFWKSRNGIVIKRSFSSVWLTRLPSHSSFLSVHLQPSEQLDIDTHRTMWLTHSLWKNRGCEREKEKRKRDRECPSSQPLLCLTLCRYGFAQTLLLIRSLDWQTLRQRAAVCSVIRKCHVCGARVCVCVRVETYKQPRRSQCCLDVITPP